MGPLDSHPKLCCFGELFRTPVSRAAGLAQAERSDDLGQGRPSPDGPSYKHCHGRYT
jgi:hypothetical protein